jgi:drug/metabolite transporter (DMT)-like permease
MGNALPVTALVVNAFVWGVSWWPFRELLQAGLHPLFATFFIYGLSLICLLAIRPGAWRLLGKHRLLILLALAAGLTNVGFNWAVTIGDVVRVVLLFYLMPAWVVLLAWPLLGEKPGAGSLLRLLLALSGVIVVLKVPGSDWPVPSGLADWLALMGGFGFALTNILLRKLNHTPEEGRMLAMFGGGALLPLTAALVLMQVGGVPALPPVAPAWLLITLATSLAFLVGNLCLQYGAARLSANATALIMLTELIFASASSVLLDAGELSSRSLAGGSLILLAALWACWPTGALVKSDRNGSAGAAQKGQ